MLDKKYSANEKENKWLNYWKDNGIYDFKPDQREIYSILVLKEGEHRVIFIGKSFFIEIEQVKFILIFSLEKLSLAIEESILLDNLYILFPILIFPFILPNWTIWEVDALFIFLLFSINSEIVYLKFSFSKDIVSPKSTLFSNLHVISPLDELYFWTLPK